MKSKKLRRHSGRVTPRIFLFGKKQEIIEDCLEPKEYWDDWKDYRDGFRISKDKSQLRNRFMSFAKNLEIEKWNKKIKLLIKKRAAKRQKLKRKTGACLIISICLIFSFFAIVKVILI